MLLVVFFGFPILLAENLLEFENIILRADRKEIRFQKFFISIILQETKVERVTRGY